MRIIDTHVHLGTSRFTEVKTTGEELIEAMERYNVISSLVMPQPTLEDISKVHQKIYDLSQTHLKKFFGIASVDPWLSEEEYSQEIKTCMEDYHFVAIKLHPLGHNISPLHPNCLKIYSLASRYNVPVIVHTGLGNPFSLPSLVIEPARQFPSVQFILAHAGFAVYTDEAIVAADCCENIVLEPSWCPTYAVKKMIQKVGRERIIMGSDHLTNLPVELMKYQSIGLSGDELEKIFFSNPNRIFRLNLEKDAII